MLIYIIKASLWHHTENDIVDNRDITSINWSGVEFEIATDFHLRREHISNLCKGFLEDSRGHVFVFGGDDCGQGAEG